MNPKEIFNEWIKTFSNKDSFLSSKRIERFVIFSVMLLLTIIFLGKGIFECSILATDFAIVITLWLGLAGFNTIQGRKDKNGEADKPEEGQK